ncbi:MAG: tetratricopeptide repeat protein [Candidatus Omnitrophota bacterium]
MAIICNLVLGAWNFSFADEPDPKEEEALFVAKKAFEDGFYEVSLGLLERFLKNYPDSVKLAEVDLLTGQCFFRQNKFLDALNKFEGLLNKPAAKGIQDAVNYWIAEVHFKGGNFSKAREYYQKVIDGFPESEYRAAAYYSLGWCYAQERDFNKALEYFSLVEEKFPKEPYSQEAVFKIIECLYNLKEYPRLKEKIKNYLKSYAKDSVKTAYFGFYAAEADYYLNNLEDAARGYTAVASATQDEKIRTLCRLGAGWAYLKLKQYKEADANFQMVKVENMDRVNSDALLLGKAALASETKSFSEAEKLYREVVNTAVDPAVIAQGYSGAADALYNMAQYSEAVKVYKEGIEKVPAAAAQDILDKLHYGLAWAFLKEGEFKDAIEEFRKIAKLSEDKIVKVSALCQIGDAYQDSGEFNKAIETYGSILKNYPDNFYADYVQYQMGLSLLKLSNYDAAIAAFKALTTSFPASKLLDDASYALGLAYFQREDYGAAKDTFEKFLLEFKDSALRPQAMYLLGTSLYNLEKFEEAITAFKNTAKAFSQDTDLVQKCEYEIADCFYRMGNEKEAMERFKSLRSRYPDSQLTPEVMWWLGEYYYRNDDLELARRYFSSLVRDFSKSELVPDAYYALGISFAEESKYEEAIDNFKKVVEMGRSDLAGTAAIAVADIYLRQEKLELALNNYRQVLDNYQNLAHLIYPKLGGIYYKMRSYDQALDYYRKSLDLVPVKEMSSIQFNIAEILQAQGKPDEAVEAYLKVPYLYSEDKDLTVKSLLRVAAAYEDKEDFREALNVYKRVAAMDADESKYARERIDWIRANVKTGS